MERIVKKSKSFEEAEAWERRQYRSMTPVEQNAGGPEHQRPSFSRQATGRARMPHQPKNSIESSHFSPDTVEFIRLFGAHQARYVVVGGEAVIYHGYPRFTGDINFFFSDAPDNVEAVFAALREFWGGTVPGIQSAQELAEPGVIVQFGRPPNRIDLLNRIDGVEF